MQDQLELIKGIINSFLEDVTVQSHVPQIYKNAALLTERSIYNEYIILIE